MLLSVDAPSSVIWMRNDCHSTYCPMCNLFTSILVLLTLVYQTTSQCIFQNINASDPHIFEFVYKAFFEIKSFHKNTHIYWTKTSIALPLLYITRITIQSHVYTKKNLVNSRSWQYPCAIFGKNQAELSNDFERTAHGT